MLEALKVIILGIVQGITEWLPISSTGHLILVEELIKLQQNDAFKNMFNVVIQFGSIMAVVVIYFHKLNPFSPTKTQKQKMMTIQLWIKVIIGTLPAMIVGLLLNDWIEAKMSNAYVVAFMLILYGILFIVIENINAKREPRVTKLSQLSVPTVLLIGVFQMMAMIPGTSRSGATIVGALALGVSRGVAAEFTFFLAIPVIRGRKTDKEKFAGAEATYTIESLMHDGKALQSGTSHNFGDGFAKAFNIQYLDKDNKLKYVHQTSWGMTTRMVGAIIMVHGDNNGLVLPPKVAPTQVMIVPIQQAKEGVLDKAFEVKEVLSNFRVKVDDSDKSPGWKFSESEMRGIPVRVEIGPRDIAENQAVLVRRDTHEKITVSLDEIAAKVGELLETIHHDMFERAKAHRDSHTYVATTLDEMKEIAENKPGFIKAMWCGNQECEDKLKEVVGVTSRCIPFNQEHLADTCVCCGKPATKMVYWGKAY